jgi:hypothetical protein
MQRYANMVFIKPILIAICIFLVLLGSNARLIIEARTAGTTTIAAISIGSLNTQSLIATHSTLPVPGLLSAKINCAELASKDFSKIPDAATKITSATLVSTSFNNSIQTCKITGITAPHAMFVIQLPVAQWNGDYFQGGCGGLCGSLHEQADCSTALGRGAAIGYSDLGPESTSMNDISWALQENL